MWTNKGNIWFLLLWQVGGSDSTGARTWSKEENTAVWVMFSSSPGCGWESCCAAIWRTSCFGMAASDTVAFMAQLPFTVTITFSTIKCPLGRFWAQVLAFQILSSVYAHFPDKANCSSLSHWRLLLFPAPVTHPPKVRHKPYYKQRSKSERHRSCHLVLKSSKGQWMQMTLHLQK